MTFFFHFVFVSLNFCNDDGYQIKISECVLTILTNRYQTVSQNYYVRY